MSRALITNGDVIFGKLVVFSKLATERTKDPIGTDSETSPRYTSCSKNGALSLASSTWTITKQLAEAEAILVARTVKLKNLFVS